MKITFLGTGTSQGIPMIANNEPVCLSDNPRDKRLRSSIMISWNDIRYIVDCGPDFRQQMLRENIQSINGVLFTHEHADHTAGLDDIRPFNFKMGAMPIYAHERVIDNLKYRFNYIFETENRYPGAPSVVVNEVLDNTPLQLGNMKVQPISVMHGDLQVYGYRFGKFAYLTDVKTIVQEEIEKLKDLDVLVVNALREEPHHSHFNLDEALQFIELVKPKKAYLTHVSHMLGFHEEIQKRLPKNVFLAYDNLEITI